MLAGDWHEPAIAGECQNDATTAPIASRCPGSIYSSYLWIWKLNVAHSSVCMPKCLILITWLSFCRTNNRPTGAETSAHRAAIRGDLLGDQCTCMGLCDANSNHVFVLVLRTIFHGIICHRRFPVE